MDAIHLNREGDTDINSLPHYSLPAFSLILYLLLMFSFCTFYIFILS